MIQEFLAAEKMERNSFVVAELFGMWLTEQFSIYSKKQKIVDFLGEKHVDANRWNSIQNSLKECFHNAIYYEISPDKDKRRLDPSFYSDENFDPSTALQDCNIPGTLKDWFPIPKWERKTPIEFLQNFRFTKKSWKEILDKLKKKLEEEVTLPNKEARETVHVVVKKSYPIIPQHLYVLWNESLVERKLEHYNPDYATCKFQSFFQTAFHGLTFANEAGKMFFWIWFKARESSTLENGTEFENRYVLTVNDASWLQKISQRESEYLITLTESYLCQSLPVFATVKDENLQDYLAFYHDLCKKSYEVAWHSIESRDFYRVAIGKKLQSIGIKRAEVITVQDEFALEIDLGHPEKWTDDAVNKSIERSYRDAFNDLYFSSPDKLKDIMKQIHSFHKKCQSELFDMLKHEAVIPKENGCKPHILGKGRVLYEGCMVADGKFQAVIDQITVRAFTAESVKEKVKQCVLGIVRGRYLEHLARQNNLLNKEEYKKWKDHHQVLISFAALYQVLKDKPVKPDGTSQKEPEVLQIKITKFWRNILVDEYMLYKEKAPEKFLQKLGIDKEKWDTVIKSSVGSLKSIIEEMAASGVSNQNPAIKDEIEIPGDIAEELHKMVRKEVLNRIQDRQEWTEALNRCRDFFKGRLQDIEEGEKSVDAKEKEMYTLLQEQLCYDKDLKSLIENLKKATLFHNEAQSIKMKKEKTPDAAERQRLINMGFTPQEPPSTQDIAGHAIKSIKDIRLLIKHIRKPLDPSTAALNQDEMIGQEHELKEAVSNLKEAPKSAKEFYEHVFPLMDKILIYCQGCAISAEPCGTNFCIQGLMLYLKLFSRRPICNQIYHAEINEYSLHGSVALKEKVLYGSPLSTKEDMKKFLSTGEDEYKKAMEELMTELRKLKMDNVRHGAELVCKDGVLSYKYGKYEMSQSSLIDQLTFKIKEITNSIGEYGWRNIQKKVFNVTTACYSLVRNFLKEPNCDKYECWVKDFQVWISLIVLHVVIEDKLKSHS